MKNYLFPRYFQIAGWILFVPSLATGILLFLNSLILDILSFSGMTETVVNDAAIIGTTIGALFIVCSKERHEDEMTRSIRLNSLLKSIYVYAGVLVLATLLINGIPFFTFMSANLVLMPLIYVLIFRIEMHRYNKLSSDE